MDFSGVVHECFIHFDVFYLFTVFGEHFEVQSKETLLFSIFCWLVWFYEKFLSIFAAFHFIPLVGFLRAFGCFFPLLWVRAKRLFFQFVFGVFLGRFKENLGQINKVV